MRQAVAQQQAQGAGQGRQPQRFAQHQPGHAARRRAQHAQHGQVKAALAHGIPQRNEHTQRRHGQQHAAKGAQHIGAHAQQAQQAGHFNGRCGGLHRGVGVDGTRQRHSRQRRAVAHQGHGHFALLLQDFQVFGVVGRGGFVHLPHRFGAGEDEPVEHAAAGRQHAADAVGVVAMRMPAPAQPVAADEGGPHQGLAGMVGLDDAARCAGAQHSVHGLLPQRAFGQGGAVVRHVIRRGAHDAIALVAVTQAERHHLGHQRVLLQRLHLLQGDVARGHVDVEHPRQDELQRAALGAHHQVNAFQVTLKSPVELGGHQQHQRDGGQPQGKQQQVECGGQGPRPQVTPCQCGCFCYIFHSF